ncbi:histidine kinase, partial [Streptomyces sp. SB3404]|nr:histidine kinase [Streptomyces boncukensis]
RGLAGVAERAALLGGTARAGAHDDGVWRLTARLPLPPGAQRGGARGRRAAR